MSEQKEETVNNDYASFDISMSGNTELKEVFGVVSEIVEDATFTIDPEGMSFRAMDPSHVCLVNVTIPNACFEKYEVSKEGSIALRVEEVFKIIKALKKKDTIRLTTTDDYQLSISTKYNKTKLRMIEASKVDTPLPKISYNSMIVLELEDLKSALNQIKVVSEYVTLESMPTIFKLSGMGDSVSNEITFEKGMQEMPDIDIRENSKATYSLEYILAFVKHLTKGRIVLDYSEKMPLRFEVSLVNVGKIHFYLAPRVEN